MAGLDQAFTGEAWLAEGASVGYLAPEPQLDPQKTVIDNVMDGVKKKTADAAMKKGYEHRNSRLAAFFVLIRKPHRSSPAKAAAIPPNTIRPGLKPKASERVYSN